MPDPTPTPDTLRAAIDSLGESARAGFALSPARQVTLRGLLIDAYAVLAGLAASPAPTDSPACICGPDSTGENPDERPDCPVHRADVRCACGHMRDLSHDADGECWRAPCRCDSFRPAAVTAPREDEALPPCAYCLTHGFDHQEPGSKPLAVWVGSERDRDGQPTTLHVAYSAGAHVGEGEAEWVRRAVRLAAAAPAERGFARPPALNTWRAAVERATPDPDTLAALLDDAFVYVDVGTGPFSLIDTTATARALIAAGVTLNETATTPTQEDAK